MTDADVQRKVDELMKILWERPRLARAFEHEDVREIEN